jgi:[acyl-carrier-protein] S-malonyltransferase
MAAYPDVDDAGIGPAAVSRPDRLFAMFPGQGSQRVAMAVHLLRDHPRTVGRVFAAASEAVGLPLTSLCTNGSAAELARTEITQPAVVATSLAVLEVLRTEGGFSPWAVAGHSLGEYAALVAASVLSPADALWLVRRRGKLMAQVAGRVPGTMAAVIGLEAEVVEEVCARCAGLGLVQVANYNEPSQTVISGERAAVEEVARLAREAGAERTVLLGVGAPFHCALMADIEQEFAAELDRCHFGEPSLLVFSSVTGEPVSRGDEIRRLLQRQLSAPVRWVKLLDTAARLGATRYVEVGPGRVLGGFAKRTVADARVHSTNDARRIAKLLRSDY